MWEGLAEDVFKESDVFWQEEEKQDENEVEVDEDEEHDFTNIAQRVDEGLLSHWARPKGASLLRSIFRVPHFVSRVQLILQRRANRDKAAHTKEFSEVIDLV